MITLSKDPSQFGGIIHPSYKEQSFCYIFMDHKEEWVVYFDERWQWVRHGKSPSGSSGFCSSLIYINHCFVNNLEKQAKYTKNQFLFRAEI